MYRQVETARAAIKPLREKIKVVIVRVEFEIIFLLPNVVVLLRHGFDDGFRNVC